MGGVDQYAPAVLKAGLDNGISPRGIVIAFATVFVESNWVMYANPADPPSMSFPHDALSFDADSDGLFQQRPEWWGTVAQRMDAYQSAVMFFNQLKNYDYDNVANTAGFYAQQVQKSAYPDRYDEHVADAQALYDKLTASAVEVSKVVTPLEKVLSYPRGQVGDYSGVVQQDSWDCGPTSASIVLAGCGVDDSQNTLIGLIGTTTDGTNSVDDIVPVLNEALPTARYSSVWLPNDPPSQDQIEALWINVKGSIDAGFGTILNFQSPPNNRPQGTRGSVSPNYPAGGETIYHYVAGMGVAQDADGSRHVWIADPGFSPFGYWCSLEQVAGLIVPHAYAFAAARAVLVSTVTPAPAVPPAPAPAAPTPVPAPVPPAPVAVPTPAAPAPTPVEAPVQPEKAKPMAPVSTKITSIKVAFRSALYVAAGIIGVAVPTAEWLHLISADTGTAILQFASLLGAGSATTAAVVLKGQVANNTLKYSGSTADQAVAAIQDVVKEASVAQADVAKVTAAVNAVAQKAPAVGSAAEQAISTISAVESAITALKQ